MDHLSAISPTSEIQVPFLEGEMYDTGDFLTYYSRKGLPKPDLFSDDPFPSISSVPALAAFLQIWMYFGLLHHILGDVPISYDPQDFM